MYLSFFFNLSLGACETRSESQSSNKMLQHSQLASLFVGVLKFIVLYLGIILLFFRKYRFLLKRSIILLINNSSPAFN